jgi:hypothetical protein
MYLVLITYLTGDTYQESFETLPGVLKYMELNVDYVAAVEVKRMR